MKTPEEKLCSRLWRLKHSSFLLWSILSFGTLTCVGFWTIGIKSRRRSWLIFAALWTVFTISMFVFNGSYESGTKENPIRSTESEIFGWLLFFGWLGGVAHSVTARRGWLRWRAYKSPGAWYLQGSGSRSSALEAAGQLSDSAVSDVLNGARRGEAVSRTSPDSAKRSWTPPMPAAEGARPSSRDEELQAQEQAERVELNTAGVDDFLSLGITREWAEWFIATRTRLGSFSTAEQLVTEAKLPPHVFVNMKDRIQVSVSASGAPPTSDARRPGTGRRLDL
ncbi:helix-hairpin-helix domain-containing protein [Clavibacter michiganensis]|uniref:helix-hairpin-helix domain-containing protein n=1 Tax=Clavibacter michiganensis TaxID=28447 RepID=UPI0011B07378|nr:helix-hairpin-helix domain-containing protein [Clavibacter michiganensis]